MPISLSQICRMMVISSFWRDSYVRFRFDFDVNIFKEYQPVISEYEFVNIFARQSINEFVTSSWKSYNMKEKCSQSLKRNSQKFCHPVWYRMTFTICNDLHCFYDKKLLCIIFLYVFDNHLLVYNYMYIIYHSHWYDSCSINLSSIVKLEIFFESCIL